MKIVNINYRGYVPNVDKVLTLEHLAKLQPPQMIKLKNEKGTLVVFKSGKCRLMGCKEPITSTKNLFPFPIVLTKMQSATVSMDVGTSLNLYKIAKSMGSRKCIYEPELFPALRITKELLPLCVNVFASGKVIILGIKHLNIVNVCKHVRGILNEHNQSD